MNEYSQANVQPQSQATSAVGLPSIGQLIGETFNIYKERIWVLVGLNLITFSASMAVAAAGIFSVADFLTGSSIQLDASFIVILLVVLMLIVLNTWISLSIITAIKERHNNIGIADCLKLGWKKIFSAIWINILTGLAVLAGFILFVVPGIIFAVWFSLSMYVLVAEGLTGTGALKRSKQLVSGYWWGIVGRSVLFGLLLWLVSFIISFIPIAGSLFVSIFLVPFYFIFPFLIYESLKTIKSDPSRAKGKFEVGYFVAALVVIIVIPAMLIASIVSLVSMSGARDKAIDTRATIAMSQMRAEAEISNAIENSYSLFSCNYGSSMPSICADIKQRVGAEPIIKVSENNYCAYVELKSGEYYCIDSWGSAVTTTVFPGGTGYCSGSSFECPSF